ncbi:glycoside hydrolase family 55 protein [Botryobasidium botryosum FD-172 SS1]|uniref:Glycoside hydrolase family 55 protein n=1 Tax=Botryobasidium botryosum (strain FD-172 SS1) TaxID=930990 RepID=A0A067LUF8_BOTB1|nr:glycoside hydrolase family 55 protein [Botryobasidium botryosum FD-172 SS1]
MRPTLLSISVLFFGYGVLSTLGSGSAPGTIHPSTTSLESRAIAKIGAALQRDVVQPPPQSGYWLGQIQHRGTSAFNDNPSSYKVYRNVKDYGAKGDGVTDDTNVIHHLAFLDGNRCGQGCASSTVTPALVFFPSGTYVVSQPIVPYYYTAMVGDAKNPPTLLATPDFNGAAVIDSDPYTDGNNWWINQSNFYRAVRNFVIDIRNIPASQTGTGVHWQVAQATSLHNVRVEASTAPGSMHRGENGSGGFLSDVTFNGGQYGMFVGNQQFTVRNLRVSNAQTAVYSAWGWAWTYQGVHIHNCSVGFDVELHGSNNILDAKVSNTKVFVKTANTDRTSFQGSIVLDNVKLTNVTDAVTDANGTVLPGGNATISQWVQGNTYSGASGTQTYVEKSVIAPVKPAALLDRHGNVFARARPQYHNLTAADIISVKAEGAIGDGQTDDTAALQATLNKHAGSKVVYFDAGTYRVTSTLKIPVGSKVVGEVWSTILAYGSAFNNITNPTVVVQVGQVGDVGAVELSDLMFSTYAGSAGAIILQINVKESQQGSVGVWDCHFRLGGAKGLGLGANECPAQGSGANCISSFLSLHITKSASAYFENVWAWTADHDNDDPQLSQIDIYSGRGILSESSNGPVWFIGTASEHHALYQYNIVNSTNVYAGAIQTETPYYEPNQGTNAYFASLANYHDPVYQPGASALALTIQQSSDVFIYGTGLYSFFSSYSQDCSGSSSCQSEIVEVGSTNINTWIFGLSTAGSTSMLNIDGKPVIDYSVNVNSFPSTVTAFTTGRGHIGKAAKQKRRFA